MSRTATPLDLIPDPHRVLGTVLRPFSLGHHLLLRKVESPYPTEPTILAEPDQLALAVFLCARPYSATHESLVRGDWQSEFHAWLRKLKPRALQKTRFEHEHESRKFAAYLAAGYARPPVHHYDLTERIEVTAPEECLLLCRLIAAGFAENAVMEKYLPAAWYSYYTVCELAQAENLNNPARWRKIFYTERDGECLHHPPSRLAELGL